MYIDGYSSMLNPYMKVEEQSWNRTQVTLISCGGGKKEGKSLLKHDDLVLQGAFSPTQLFYSISYVGLNRRTNIRED